MADNLPEAIEPYPNISPKAYEHPADRAATAALKSIPWPLQDIGQSHSTHQRNEIQEMVEKFAKDHSDALAPQKASHRRIAQPVL